MGQSSIVDAAGRAFSKGLDTRTWRPENQRPCRPDMVCEGMRGMITTCANKPGDRIAVLMDEATGAIEGLGYLLANEGQMCIFNTCPFCGERLNLPANR